MSVLQRWVICVLAFSYAGTFFVDVEHPIIFENKDKSFGHQVVQLDGWVIVSAPLHQGTGKLYRCNPNTTRCFPISGMEDGMNMSLGLAVAAWDNPLQLIVCGPTLQRTCGHNIYVNGRCHLLDGNLRRKYTLPKSLPECSFCLDIVFLIDSSSSVNVTDFNKTAQFVSHVISGFNETGTEFALMQYAYYAQTLFNFTRFSTELNFSLLNTILPDHRKMTYTGKGILTAIEQLFVPRRRFRNNSQQVLIVVTDGESNDPKGVLDKSISRANKLGIKRISIGVGENFTIGKKYEELKRISSSPDYIFPVYNFSTLSQIQSSLQNTIFSIEGTQTKNATSIQWEFSQEGFSVDLTPDGVILGAVGAYDWSGGVYIFKDGHQNGTWINATKDQTDMVDSYLGYSVLHLEKDLIATGAPRYKYTGKVLIYKRDPKTSEWKQKAAIYGETIGSYFGSVLSVARLNLSHILLVGAPTYYSLEGPGGRVYLCPLPTQEVNTGDTPITIMCPETLQGDTGQPVGHFGSAISVLPDLSGDQLPDLAVGAPCEDNYQGAVYIFLGQPGGFRPSYIQRITGSLLSSRIKFFGRSLRGNLDLTGDGLPDLTVGSEGQVFVLRSHPVVSLSVSMRFHPREIPLSSYECSVINRTEQASNITVCFTQELRSARHVGGISAQVNYTLMLDTAFILTRAVFSHQPVSRTMSSSLELAEKPRCAHHTIIIPECVEDSLFPLRVFLNFSVIGSAVLSEDSKRRISEELLFQKNCGGDGVCEDDLKVNITFSNVTELVVGADLDISVTVSVRNEGDDSFNARILIPFPSSLSYRRVSLVESNRKVGVSCSTTEDQRVLNCAVNRPLLRANTMVEFMVDFHVSPTADLGDMLMLTASAVSDNRVSSNDATKASSQLRVLYAIYVTITSLEESSKYQNFTSHDTSIQHIYKPQITKCVTKALMAPTENYQKLLSPSPLLNCSVGWCVRADCQINDLEAQSSLIFTINGSVTKDWTTQMEQEKISLQSWAEIVYDNWTYHQSQHVTRAQAQTVLEVLEGYNYLSIIVGSSVGGLVLLALIIAALYKMGFFKRQYKEMLESPEDVNMEEEEA
ncbi:integrin alpha-D-like isoform X2 [Aquarana catesbeiana]|uniref:integrin alpha-D-like isoform X2 n=1 Tax=Aquarana catesbeiana TaxID=8400 RepID=UPI003CCA45BA